MGRVIGYTRLVKVLVVNQHTSIHVDIIHARTTILFFLNYNTFKYNFSSRFEAAVYKPEMDGYRSECWRALASGPLGDKFATRSQP